MQQDKNMKIEVNKQEIFTDYVWSFMMPDHEHWKKEIENIVLVEKNKSIHNFSTENLQDKPVRAHKTAWDSFRRYPAVFNIVKIIAAVIKESIEQEGWEAPNLTAMDGWINWFEKNQFAHQHQHNTLLSAVYYVSSEHSPSEFFFHRDDRFRLRKENEESNIKLVKPKEGSVIFFTGCQSHSVSANTSDQTRITLAINYMGDYVKNWNPYDEAK